MTTAEIRPDWRTVQRRGLDVRPLALAAREGACPHGHAVEEDEPIVLLGSAVVQEPDGTRMVDLSGADWHPQQCIGAPS